MDIRAIEALRAILEQVPAIKLERIARESQVDHTRWDIVARMSIAGKSRILVCEVRESGQPRHVRTGLLRLRNGLLGSANDVTPVLIAPFLSSESQGLCREQGVAFLDLEGNVRLAFDGVFIERMVASRPVTERRALRSLFKPKSARVLAVMLRDPARAWRVADLAETAEVSLGHASNVRAALLDREWARITDGGLRLSAPDKLLDAWRNAYQAPVGRRLAFYTTLHGSTFENAVRHALRTGSGNGQAILASFSAARWLAPFARTGTQFFYADESGLGRLQVALALSSPAMGENVIVTLPMDHWMFRDAIAPSEGIMCSGLIQTYLDLSASGERGREAAEHLRRERLRWDA